MTILKSFDTTRSRQAQKLSLMSEGYRVAAEILDIATAHGADDALVEDIFRVCQREAQTLELTLARKRA